jgi:hypothetical protein
MHLNSLWITEGVLDMNEEQNKRVAEFRFSVISSLVGFVRLSRGQKEAIIRELCGRQWEVPYSGRSFLSRSTILNWARLYEKGGRRIEALYPDERLINSALPAHL